MFRNKIDVISRLILFGVAIALIDSGLITDLVAIGVAVIVIVIHHFKNRPKQTVTKKDMTMEGE